MTDIYHIPVLLKETVDGIFNHPDGIYVDATYGAGGHSKYLFSKIKNGGLIAFDQDAEALSNRIDSKNFILIKSNFKYIKNYLNFMGIEQIDGLMADLGVSWHQFDTAARGFSFRFDSPLDMRMNQNSTKNAEIIVNNYSVDELSDIIQNYGEIPRAHLIAKAIVEYRKKQRIHTTFQLIEAVEKFVPKKDSNKFLAQLFQAIRIETNDEIENLKTLLKVSVEILKKGARIAIISYHSVEDRIVKNFFKTGNFEGIEQKDFYGNIIRPLAPIDNAIKPAEEEINKNPRSRSAKLRIAEKL